MKEITRHDHGIIRVKIPLPFPLRWVNAYLIAGVDGYTLIDPGLHTPEAETMWRTVFQQLKLQFSDIEKIVLTHHHPDHYGLSGWMQQISGAPVYMSEQSKRQADLLWSDSTLINKEICRLFERHGMDRETSDHIQDHLESFIPLVSPQPQVSYIAEQSSFELGHFRCELIDAPGHATGQLCFYDRDSQMMFCGDQVIPRLSPNVSFIPGGDPNPLHSYMTSLNELSEYTVSYAFPGHRDPFGTFSERAKEIIVHHNDRLAAILDLLKSPLTAYGLCGKLFGSRLSIHQLRFAMAETLAHTQYLLLSEQLVEIESDGAILYQSK